MTTTMSKTRMMAVLAAVLSCSQFAAAQVPTQPMPVVIVEPAVPDFKNRISASPLGLLFGIGNFTYERAIGDHWSLDLSPSGVYMNSGDDEIYGGAFGIGATFYITGPAPRGLKLSANVAPGFVGSSESDDDFMLFAKATFGYNWIWSSGFSMGLAAGAQFVYLKNAEVDTSFRGILPTIDFNIGFAF